MTAPFDLLAIDQARTAYIAAVKRGDGPSSVVKAVVGAYLAVSHVGLPPIKRRGSLSPTSQTIAALSVGASVELRGVNAANLGRYFQTARRLIDNDGACWTARTLPDGSVRIARNADGVSARDPTRNALAVELAAMSLGAARLFVGNLKGGTWQNAKIQARRILQDDFADWSRRWTSKGLRVRRVIPGEKLESIPVIIPHDVAYILRRTAYENGLSVADLRGSSRTTNITRARWTAIWRIRDLTTGNDQPRYSLPTIGGFIGRDHTSVLHALKKRDEGAYGRSKLSGGRPNGNRRST